MKKHQQQQQEKKGKVNQQFVKYINYNGIYGNKNFPSIFVGNRTVCVCVCAYIGKKM